jgi:hypothetical protein
LRYYIVGIDRNIARPQRRISRRSIMFERPFYEIEDPEGGNIELDTEGTLSETGDSADQQQEGS